MIKLVPRTKKSPIISAIIPILAVGLTMIFGGILFWILGKDPFETIRMIFWYPLMNETFADYARPQILVKAAPLILIAIGLSFGFRANIWNIGAEGQFIMGAIFFPTNLLVVLVILLLRKELVFLDTFHILIIAKNTLLIKRHLKIKSLQL